MILYHGSDTIIKTIDLNKCKPFKDFGKGFYLSDNNAQAFELAQIRANISGGTPIVNQFEFDERLLDCDDVKVRIFDSYCEEWAQFVLNNREGITTETFDIVKGPIANDKIGLQIRLLREHYINNAEFLERLKYMKGITFQYFFGTPKAISLLKPIN